MGRAVRIVVHGGLPEVGWLRANIVGRRRNTKILTRRNNSSSASFDKTAATGAAPNRNGRESAFGVGRHSQPLESGVVSRWKARAIKRLEGRTIASHVGNGPSGR